MLKITINSISPKILEVTVDWQAPVPAIDPRLTHTSPEAERPGSIENATKQTTGLMS